MAAVLVFRSGRRLAIQTYDNNIRIMEFDTNNQIKRPPVDIIIVKNHKTNMCINIDNGEYEYKILGNKKANFQVCLYGNILILPPTGQYLEAGLCVNGHMQKTDLEESMTGYDCLVYASQTEWGTENQFFMRCGQFRFIPGDIRPIE